MGVDPIYSILLDGTLRNGNRRGTGVTYSPTGISGAIMGALSVVPTIYPPTAAAEAIYESPNPEPPSATVISAILESVKLPVPSSTPISARLTPSDLASGKEDAFVLDSICLSMSLIPLAWRIPEARPAAGT